MKLIQFIYYSVLSFMVRLDYTATQSDERKELLAVLVGDYVIEHNGLNWSWTAHSFTYENYPNAGLGNLTVTMLRQMRIGGSPPRQIVRLGLSDGNLILRRWIFQNSSFANLSSSLVTSNDISLYAECDIWLSRDSYGVFNGSTYLCASNTSRMNNHLRVKLNCTHFVFEGRRGYVSLKKEYRRSVPSQFALNPTPCADVQLSNTK